MQALCAIRLVVGRMILGAGLSASAGAVLMVFKEMPPTALVGIASALGILGQSALEVLAQQILGKIPDDRKDRGESGPQ
ncbi:hypothetical protein [Paraburkholderia sp. MM5477-R1]|uniref:hypothetical protein n=1 Tax=Paraburkholderia sp. MM5477-R1 TaxID=2991062 RepID=UPI003D190C95